MKFLLAALMSFSLVSSQGKFFYSITYKINDSLVTETLSEKSVTIRFDEEWDSEYYDNLSSTLHLSPGRMLN